MRRWRDTSLTLGLVVQCLRCLGSDRSKVQCRLPSHVICHPHCTAPADSAVQRKDPRVQFIGAMGFIEGCRQRIIIHPIEEKQSMPPDRWLYALAAAQVIVQHFYTFSRSHYLTIYLPGSATECPTGKRESVALGCAAHSAYYSSSCGHSVTEPGSHITLLLFLLQAS